MRILMLSWRSPWHPRAGGAEAYTENLLTRLAARGHQVTWFTGRGGPRGQLPGISLVQGGSSLAVYPAGQYFARRRQADFDVVVDQVNTLGFLAHQVVRKPVVAFIHQVAADVWSYETRWPVSRMGMWLEAKFLGAYRDVPYVTVSERTRRDVIAHGWRRDGLVAWNGVAGQVLLAGRRAAPAIVWVGRLGARAKRLDHALQAWALLPAPRPALWIIGRGIYRGPLPAGVTLYASASDALKYELLASAWVLWATSVREGWGLSVMEAATQGTPAIAYKVPGLSESVVHGRTGLLTEPTPRALAAATARYLANPDRLQVLGAAAQARASQFTWDRTAEAWATMLARTAAAEVGHGG